MRVLVILGDLFDSVGGIQTFNRALVRALAEIPEEPRLTLSVLILNDKKLKGACEHLNRRVRCKSFAGDKWGFAWAALREGLRADVVFCGHVHFSPILAGIGMFRRKAERYLIVHGIEVWKRLSAVQRFAAGNATRILSVSAWTRDRMTALNALPQARFDLFPNTIDPDFGRDRWWQSRCREMELPAGRMILSVSRLDATERLKGIDQMIDVLPAVMRAVPDAFYVVVGDGGDRARLEQLTEARGLSAKVFFVGKVSAEQLVCCYKHCVVFALPSMKEGFGIVYLEAMSMGKPCIGARFGGVPEVIADDETGLLVEPDNRDELVKALVRLLNDPDQCRAMGEAGRERFEREFSFAAFRNRLEALITKSAGRGGWHRAHTNGNVPANSFEFTP